MKKSKKTAKAAPKKSPANTSGINPLHDRVLVKPLSQEELNTATSFGLLIPDTVSKEKPEQGIVVAVGPGKRSESGSLIAPSVKVGDKVVFSKYGYDELKVGGVEYYVLPESSILAVLK